ncbi:Allatostatin insect [Trinorchestia longiramus]|nr:Allatostatin insect [Trinorchestia longiramus]
MTLRVPWRFMLFKHPCWVSHSQIEGILVVSVLELALKQEALTQQILNDVAEYLDPASRAKSLSPASANFRDRAWQKRTITPFSGGPDELQTIKRQIRYHQCYFNPISCFSRK